MYKHYCLSLGLTAGIMLFLGVFVLLQKKEKQIALPFFLYCLSLATWCSGQLLALEELNKTISLFFVRNLCHSGVTFIPIFFLHFVLKITNRYQAKRKILLFAYSCGITLLLIGNFSPLLVRDVGLYPPIFNYVYLPGIIHPYYVLWFMCFIFYVNYLLFREFLVSNGNRKNQMKYLLVASFFSQILAAPNFLLGYRMQIPILMPFGTYFFPFSIALYAYAILKYRLMDIKFAITSTGIFLTIYTAVLGIPFWLGFGKHLWIYSLLSMGILATAGPFIYGKLKQQAERKILRKQIEYQHALRSLAKTITQVKDLESLFDHIVTNVYDLVRPEYAAIYILSTVQKAYVLKIKRSFNHPAIKERFALDSTLAQALNHDKKAIFSELINDPVVNETMIETILVPFFAEERLYGIMTVGAKVDKSLYGQGDIEVFDILSSEMSIAVENLLFWKEEKSRIQREEQIRRQKAMDNFSASLAHEIDNPIFSVQCAIDALKQDIAATVKGLMPDDKLEYIITTLTEIGQSTRRISKIIKAIREFSGKNTGEMKPLNMDEVADNLISIVEPQIKHENITFGLNICHDLFIKGNKIHLIELLMNLTSNSIHAVKHSGSPDKEISLAISRNSGSTCLVQISDNGYGIEPDLIEDIFLDFVTTKPSGEGSGMGLARCRTIAENHHGKMWAQSPGKGKGAKFFVELPLLR